MRIHQRQPQLDQHKGHTITTTIHKYVNENSNCDTTSIGEKK